MDYFRYILEAHKQKFFEKTHLTEREFEFFFMNVVIWEIDNGPFSVYQIHKNMKNRGDKMAYKNVHQKLQKLFSLGLLKEVEYNKRSFHGARFYMVSSKGWFNLLINSRAMLPFRIDSSIQRAIKKYYSKNLIFETFISPYINPESLIFIDGENLLDYLINCCRSTIDSILSRKIDSIGVSINNFTNLAHSGRSASGDPMNSLKEEFEQTINGHFRSLVIKLILSLSGQDTGKYSHVSVLSSQLASDDKFMNIINEVDKEFSMNIKYIKRSYYHKNRG